MKLECVATFIAIADMGSISEACRRLGLSRSIVSERLADLERSLDTVLIQRTTRRMTLTEDGKAFLVRARNISREVTEAAAELTERKGQLVGPLRISGPISFCILHLGRVLYPFLRQHPRIELVLELDDRFVDVEASGFDAVIRHGEVRESWLVAIRIARSRRVLVGSPAYLARYGAPRSLAELEAHQAILYTNRISDWRFDVGAGSVSVSPKNRSLRVNNGLIMRDAALDGMGLALLPTFIVHSEIKSGLLQVVDIGHTPEPAELHLTYTKAHQPSAKLRALIVHLKAAFGDPPYWDVDADTRHVTPS